MCTPLTLTRYDSGDHTSLMIGSIFYAVTYGLIGPAILLIMYYRGMKARKGAMKSYYFGFLVKGYDKVRATPPPYSLPFPSSQLPV